MNELTIAVILAALAKTLDQLAPKSKQQFYQNMKEMTLEELVEALKIVKAFRSANTPEEIDQHSLQEAKAYLKIQDWPF